MQYEMFIGLRYLLSRRKDRSISIITWISICGVMLGVVALIVSTSLMNGFKRDLQDSIIGTFPNIEVYGLTGDPIEIENLEQQIRENPKVVHTSPYILKQAFLTGKKLPKGALIRGIDPENESKITKIESFLRDEIYALIAPEPEEQARISKRILKRLSYKRSRKNKEKAGIILGAALAHGLAVLPGDIVELVTSETRMTIAGEVPRVKKLEVIGIFESGISGYDEVLAFIDYQLIQRLYPERSFPEIGVKVIEPEDAVEVAEILKEKFPSYFFKDWTVDNKRLFQIMQLEKLLVFIVLAMMILVAAFNIISSLTMLVLEKNKEIAILKALGATDRSLLSIFMFQGIVIGAFGTLFGISMGLGLCFILSTVNIPPGVYPGGNHVPVLIEWLEVALIALISFIICFLVTIVPAFKAAQVAPAEALQYQ